MNQGRSPEGLNDLTDYYGLLDLKPDASPADIREGYFRVKATYQKDNVALYTIIDGDEREDMLRRIEEAYQVLSNPERRREYDRFYGQISSAAGSAFPFAEGSESAKVISIDRTAPMESISSPGALTAPRTDFDSPFNAHYAGAMDQPRQTPSAFQTMETRTQNSSKPVQQQPSAPSSAQVEVPKGNQEIEREILEQTDWSGAFIRKVRESRGISIEEVTQATKITKAYILAIEEENYGKLPAAVFIRGFVGQLARLLRLPHQQVAASYMSRLQRANPEKFR